MCLLILLVLVGLEAQAADLAKVIIQVTDPSGARVVNAQVRLIPVPATAPALRTTDDQGQVSVALRPGGYGLMVIASGFKKVVTHLEVRESKEVRTIPIVLRVGESFSPVVYPASYKDALFLRAFPYHEPWILQPAELAAMPHIKVAHGRDIFTGILLATLFSKLGAPFGKDFPDISSISYLIAAGSSGDESLLALAEIDPSMQSAQAIVADQRNGHPLDAQTGPLLLVIASDKRADRWVRKLTSIELKSAN